MNRPNTNTWKILKHVCLGCVVFLSFITIAACGSDDDGDSSSDGDTTPVEWQDDQVIVGDEDTGITPVGTLGTNASEGDGGATEANWTLTQSRIDANNDGTIDEVYTYEYDANGYLKKRTYYPAADDNGNPSGAPGEIIHYDVDSNGTLDDIEHDIDGNGVVDKITDYSYSDGRIDKEEIYNASTKDGSPDETWQYDYDTSEGEYAKEHYYNDDDDNIDEIVVLNSHGDTIKLSRSPDESGEYQWIITIYINYDALENISKTTTIIDIGDENPTTQVVSYEYTYDANGNIESYEADDGDDATPNSITYFKWE